MNKDRLLDALGEVKDEYILEAEEISRANGTIFGDAATGESEEETVRGTDIIDLRRRHSWIRGMAAAAAVVILCFSGLLMLGNSITDKFSAVSKSLLRPESQDALEPIEIGNDDDGKGGLYTGWIIAGCALAGAGAIILVVRKIRSKDEETDPGEE